MSRLVRLLPALVAAGTLGAGILSAAALPARAGQLIVVEARGADLKPGQSLDGGAMLTLAAGAKVVLVSAEGTTLSLKGPFASPPEGDGAGKGNRVAESLKGLVAQRTADTSSLGAARGLAGLKALPNPWLWDATLVGDVCGFSGEPPVLWRPATEAEQELVLTPADRSWVARARWPAGSATLALPRNAPIVDGVSYMVELEGKKAALTVHLAPTGLATEPMVAAWLGVSRCDRQLMALAPQLAE